MPATALRPNVQGRGRRVVLTAFVEPLARLSPHFLPGVTRRRVQPRTCQTPNEGSRLDGPDRFGFQSPVKGMHASLRKQTKCVSHTFIKVSQHFSLPERA